jgi:hypothetical protein
MPVAEAESHFCSDEKLNGRAFRSITQALARDARAPCREIAIGNGGRTRSAKAP